VLLLLLSFGALRTPSRAAELVDAVQSLERWITTEVDAKALPALSIALVDDQRIIWARGFGFADPERKIPASAGTVYRVGSVSKLITDLAVMQLVEQRRLDLDAPVTRYLPEFSPRNPFETPITLRMLMSHRSGLVREPPVGHYFDPSPPTLAVVVQSLNTTTLVNKPGTHTKYSNAGIAVVGLVVERLRGEPFPETVRRTLLDPLGMPRSSFEPGSELAKDLALGAMWTYDGQNITNPTFLLGTGPAGNLVSTVNDLGHFLSALFAEGKGPRGSIVRPETLRSMLEPQDQSSFGLGFALGTIDGRRRIGHSGAVYGFATELAALPDEKLGVVAITSKDCANGILRHIADTAFQQLLAARQGRPLPALETTKPVPADMARRLEGRYTNRSNSVELVARLGKLFLAPLEGGPRVEVRASGDGLIVDDRLAHGPALVPEGEQIVLGGVRLERTTAGAPAPLPERWEGLIGEYGWDYDVLYILEQDGRLHALIEWFFDYPLEEVGPDHFRFPKSGLYEGEDLIFTRDDSGRAMQVEAASVVFRRRKLDGESGETFQIRPVRPVEELRPGALAASPPIEPGPFRAPDLVDVAGLDSTIKLDIRYATANNFLGTPVYTTARAFLQRPAAEALLRAHQSLAEQGYGLLIHDAYRPWHVTKLFWDATPESDRRFVADPSKGSKHNRGAAVDLTLYDRTTGKPVAMVGGYDEFSPRSYPDYPGGTTAQRRYRDLLRRAMEEQGFTVFDVEWWHFDYRDWSRYPILNRRFEDLDRPEARR
jgi:CubicO group peptidase (beta-lactamase class C family)/D-alanyl-D-alanine dipeptidase